jgi:uncharacterized protein YndB with AHSA1/START domain
MPIEPVRGEVVVPVMPAAAFRAFTEGFGRWWPPEYTWAGPVLETIGMEPGEGGLCFERGPHGFRVDWGRVLAWEPPGRLGFSWQVSPQRQPVPDPDRASVVEVAFAAEGDGATRVRLEHGGFERHGEGAAGYRDAMASAPGWPLLLERFVSSAAGGE